MRNADNMDSKDGTHVVLGRDKDSTGNWSTELLVSDCLHFTYVLKI